MGGHNTKKSIVNVPYNDKRAFYHCACMCQLVYTNRAYVQIYIHSNRAGSGSQRPELLQVVTVAAPTSENPGSHRKVMIEPSIGLVS